MTITRSGMTPEAIEELINRRVEEALAAYEAILVANALEAKSQSQNGSDDDNRNGGNGNGGNRNPNENNRGARPVAQEYETAYKEWEDRMERASTIASSLDVEQDSGSGPRSHLTILGGANAQNKIEAASIQSINPPLSRGYTLGSGEDSMKLIGIDEILYVSAAYVHVSAVNEDKKVLLDLQVNTAAYVNSILPMQLNAATRTSLYCLGRAKFPEVNGWLVEDLVNYHLKELRCSAQCHTKKSMWINSRGDEELIRASRLKKVMADKGKKSSMETFAPNDKADYYFGITSITVNEKNAYELKRKFLDDLHNNAFSGTNRKDAVEHIEYYLKIIDPIKLPNVDHDKLRVVVFPTSLARGARRWFYKTKESITCWVDLTAKFFRKYYPPSPIEENNTPLIKWDPSNPKFEGWLATKFVNYKTMDVFTKGALWDYWKMGGEEIKTPLCLAFNDFNYLLKVDPDLLTKDIMGFKTYEDYKDDWIYEWNKDIPWVDEKPWTEAGREDGYCNGGKLPGSYHIGNSLHYQDLEWYEALEDSKLKDEALRNKAIMEGLISDDESCNDCWKRWKSHEIYYHNYDNGEYENETHEEGHELCSIKTP
ncbi:hypothetical protein Tco_1105665 [Tanacetum coccineum]